MDAIILAAGIGSRMKIDYPKQFLKINGKPIFIYSLEILRKVKAIEGIIVTCNTDHLEEYRRYIDNYVIENVKLIAGGKSRQESVYLGLLQVQTDRVLIHEAARPLISPDFINHLLSYDDDAIVPTVPIKFTVAMGGEYMTNELDRSKLHNVQLPQLFNTEKLLTAHKKAISDGYTTTEDGTLLFHYGGTVRFIEGRESNIKVTTQLDVELVNNILKFQQ